MPKRSHSSSAVDLAGQRVAFIVDEMFEDSEFRLPFDRVREAGGEPVIVGVSAGKELSGKRNEEKIRTDVSIDDVHTDDFTAIVIPGGYSPDHLRTNDKVVEFVRDFVETGKPCAVICHGPWLLAEAGVSEGRTLTSWPSIKTDLINAGADWVDREVVEDGNVITSRKPDDLDAFSDALIRQMTEGVPERAEEMVYPRASVQNGKARASVVER